MDRKLRLVNLLAVVVLLISACNLPSGNETENLAGTAAAQTVQALLSATPLVTPSFTLTPVTPTLTPIPLPLNTSAPIATATSNCNVGQFMADVTIPDDTIMTPGQAFTKTWRIKNVGSCAWNGFSLVFDSGDAKGGAASTAIAVVSPGQDVDLSVDLTAPSTSGPYKGYWRINTNSGVVVPIVGGSNGRSFYVQIKVQTAVTATSGTPAATNTSAPAAFAVTAVSFTVTGACPNFTFTYSITTNGAGTVNLHRVFSDPLATDTTPVTMTFASAGTQTSPVNPVYYNVAGSSSWTDLYIDSPNHQQFGRATFTCP